MSNQETVNLGQHTTIIDEATSELSIINAACITTLSADEAYNLLVWLHDYHRDRLHDLTHEEGSRD